MEFATFIELFLSNLLTDTHTHTHTHTTQTHKLLTFRDLVSEKKVQDLIDRVFTFWCLAAYYVQLFCYCVYYCQHIVNVFTRTRSYLHTTQLNSYHPIENHSL